MKIGQVSKRDTRNKATSKKSKDDVLSENCDIIVTFGFLADLEQSGDWIPDKQSLQRLCFQY